MAFKNNNVRGAKARGVGASGNPNPKANMPANNIGMKKVTMGGGKDSTFGNNVKTRGTASGGLNSLPAKHTGTVNNVGAKLNTTNYVNTGQKAKLGTTKHGVGEAPSYLRNPANPK